VEVDRLVFRFEELVFIWSWNLTCKGELLLDLVALDLKDAFLWSLVCSGLVFLAGVIFGKI
jgi:hypothetical protein